MILAWLLGRFDKRLAIDYLRFVHERRMYVWAINKEFGLDLDWRGLQKHFEGYSE